MHDPLVTYQYLVIPLAAWIVAQLAKIVIKGVHDKDWNWRYIYRSGGMPSAHATVVVSLCTILGYRLGIKSPEFGIAGIVAAIILYDAINVRHAVGEHAVALRALIPRVFKEEPPHMTVHQSFGHTPIEVLIGILIGIAFPVIVFALT